jgi:23S rRNA pseudouridine1911/1915/1917 synthase
VGKCRRRKGTIEGNLARHLKDRMQMAVLLILKWETCDYHYQVLERFGYVTLISCQLETGRTHQIRAHLNT